MEKLFTPVQIGTVLCKNRFAMAPMENGLSLIGGRVTPEAVAFLRERAANHVSLIFSGGMAVSPEGRSFTRQLSLYNEQLLPGIALLVDAVHAGGALFAAQLCHVGPQGDEAISMLRPLAPSASPYPLVQNNPRTMASPDFARIVHDFCRCAKHAEQIGCDLIELQMGNGHLLHSFLSPRTNHRADEYGGTPENRMRFPLEVFAAVHAAVQIPITLRVCVEEFVEGGFGFEAAKQLCVAAQAAGAAAISLTAGCYESIETMVAPMHIPAGYLVEYACGIKSVVDIPVMVAGRLNTPALLRQVVESGAADLVAVGRGLVADSLLATKMLHHREEEIRCCVACNEGCFDRVYNNQSMRCLVNPRAGFELTRNVTLTEHPQRIVVIGGGPGGMILARTARKRGHHVTILESSPALGGMLNVLCTLPGKQEYSKFRDFLNSQMQTLGVQVIHKPLDDADDLAAYTPDVVVVAAGARQAIPPFPVFNDADVEMAEDVLAGRAKVGADVTVIGGGNMGLQTARFLYSQGKRVHIVEMKEQITVQYGKTFREQMASFLAQPDLDVRTGCEVMAVQKGRVLLDKGEILTDSVVVAIGYYPNINCAQPVKNRYKRVYVIGDAKEPRRILNAVAEGYEAGCTM